ncbi:MAG: hypothetical protein FWF91_07295 [Coriobacteriia bacterium]|nr:hypothetical protein [Coriobacteriia bacterium]
MKGSSWVVSTKRMIIGIIVAIVISVSGLFFEELSGIDIGFVNYLMPGVGVIVFCLIALRKPKEE